MRDPGKPFGDYVLLERLARGGMAEVFLARQEGPQGFDRLVAVKRILPHLMDSEDFVRMFHDEARLAARLSHPNVVHIYEFGKVDEHHFIAMEFVDGVHAGEIIERGPGQPMPVALVARVAADACAGLNHAHRLTDSAGNPLHLVHRDISPPNLMISYEGVVKLVDFGIAKAVDMAGKTMPGIVKGKYAYMSPEQTMGKKLDGRSDVFSLGLVIWEMLAGRVALDRTDPVEAMRCIRDGRLPDLRHARPDIPAALADIVDLALANKVAQRPSAAELGNAFESFIKSWPELATSMQLSEWIHRHFPKDGGDEDTRATMATPLPHFAHEHAGAQVAPFGFAPGAGLGHDGIGHQANIPGDVDLLPRAHGDHMGQVATPVPAAMGHAPAPMAMPYGAPAGYQTTGPVPRSLPRRKIIIIAAIALAVLIGIIMLVSGSGDDSGSAAAPGATGDGGAASITPADSSDADGGGAVASSDQDAGAGAVDADRSAWLVVNTEPEGASVTLDDREPTVTPAFFDDLSVGTHQLAIELSGHADVDEELDLAKGENKRSYTLEKVRKRRGKGKLNVFTRPSCTAYLGKTKLGQTPFAGKKVDEGSYTLTCEQSGYKTASEKVRVRAGKTTKVKMTLQKR